MCVFVYGCDMWYPLWYVSCNVCVVPPKYWVICSSELHWPGLCFHSATPKNLLPTASALVEAYDLLDKASPPLGSEQVASNRLIWVDMNFKVLCLLWGGEGGREPETSSMS